MPQAQPGPPVLLRDISRKELQWLLEGSRDHGTDYDAVLRQYPFNVDWTSHELRSVHLRVLGLKARYQISDLDQVYDLISRQWTKEKEAALRAAVQKFGTRWRSILQAESDSGGLLSKYSEHQIRAKWRHMVQGSNRSNKCFRRFRLLDVTDESGMEREFRAYCSSTAARYAAKLGYELVRFLDPDTDRIHSFQIIEGKFVRKIAVENLENDMDVFLQGSKQERRNTSSSSSLSSRVKVDWVQDLTQSNALSLPMIWDLNKVKVQCPNPFSPESSTTSSQWSQPTLSAKSAIDSIRLERKCLRDKLRALKALQPFNREEKRRLKDKSRRIRLKLDESAHYREAGSSSTN